jgi:hypothetical protein
LPIVPAPTTSILFTSIDSLLRVRSFQESIKYSTIRGAYFIFIRTRGWQTQDPSFHLDGHGDGFAASKTQGGDAALAAAV